MMTMETPQVERRLHPRAYVIFALAWIAEILFIIGFSTNQWYFLFGVQHNNRGLWKICQYPFGCFFLVPREGWYVAIRVVECIALSFLSIGSILSLLYLFKKLKKMIIIAAVILLLGGVLGMVGVIVFAVKVEIAVSYNISLYADMGYSLYLTGSGSGTALLLSILMFIEYRAK